MKLEIELVPKTSWFNNLRKFLSKKDWETIKTLTFKTTNYRCEICGGKGPKHPVECHEVWDYDDVSHIQTFIRTIALCPACHRAKHLGFQATLGERNFQSTLNHIKKVNNMTDDELESYVSKIFTQHQERSQHQWSINLNRFTKKFPNINLKIDI